MTAAGGGRVARLRVDVRCGGSYAVSSSVSASSKSGVDGVGERILELGIASDGVEVAEDEDAGVVSLLG